MYRYPFSTNNFILYILGFSVLVNAIGKAVFCHPYDFLFMLPMFCFCVFLPAKEYFWRLAVWVWEVTKRSYLLQLEKITVFWKLLSLLLINLNNIIINFGILHVGY